ncbi:hypothetical protein PROFUN_07758 [Planoprotostelium fungivorum]|uniref:Transmembrane protein n=1 Tax=Planoprotostelium fungivorum TaxID=1890364 RepID=A0A2P6N1G6_9EUKA|nr:hypothetical protein PROFUN_07758 [Planoprotostelium fungivorum]
MDGFEPCPDRILSDFTIGFFLGLIVYPWRQRRYLWRTKKPGFRVLTFSKKWWRQFKKPFHFGRWLGLLGVGSCAMTAIRGTNDLWNGPVGAFMIGFLRPENRFVKRIKKGIRLTLIITAFEFVFELWAPLNGYYDPAVHGNLFTPRRMQTGVNETTGSQFTETLLPYKYPIYDPHSAMAYDNEIDFAQQQRSTFTKRFAETILGPIQQRREPWDLIISSATTPVEHPNN